MAHAASPAGHRGSGTRNAERTVMRNATARSEDSTEYATFSLAMFVFRPGCQTGSCAAPWK